MPARIRVAVRINRRHGKCRNGVPGRKAPDTPYDAVGMASEPGVGEISLRRNLDRFHSAVDVFHDAGQNLGTEHRLTGQQKRMLGIGIFSQQCGEEPLQVA